MRLPFEYVGFEIAGRKQALSANRNKNGIRAMRMPIFEDANRPLMTSESRAADLSRNLIFRNDVHRVVSDARVMHAGHFREV